MQLPRGARGRRRGVPLSEGRVQSPLSRAEVGLDDLVHVWTDFGASLGSRSPSKTQLSSQRKFKTSAMLLLEVAFDSAILSSPDPEPKAEQEPELMSHVLTFPTYGMFIIWH